MTIENLNIQATIDRFNGAVVNSASTSFVPAIPNSVTFLNMTGDVTITWDDTNKDRILSLIKKKMEEGYIFFTVKRVPIIGFERRVQVNEKNIDSMNKIVLTDEQFEKMAESLNDRDIAQAFNEGEVKLVKRGGDQRDLSGIERLKTAEDVVENQSVAVRPIAGG